MLHPHYNEQICGCNNMVEDLENECISNKYCIVEVHLKKFYRNEIVNVRYLEQLLYGDNEIVIIITDAHHQSQSNRFILVRMFLFPFMYNCNRA